MCSEMTLRCLWDGGGDVFGDDEKSLAMTVGDGKKRFGDDIWRWKKAVGDDVWGCFQTKNSRGINCL